MHRLGPFLPWAGLAVRRGPHTDTDIGLFHYLISSFLNPYMMCTWSASLLCGDILGNFSLSCCSILHVYLWMCMLTLLSCLSICLGLAMLTDGGVPPLRDLRARSRHWMKLLQRKNYQIEETTPDDPHL